MNWPSKVILFVRPPAQRRTGLAVGEASAFPRLRLEQQRPLLPMPGTAVSGFAIPPNGK